jgi:hypothetical protein
LKEFGSHLDKGGNVVLGHSKRGYGGTGPNLKLEDNIINPTCDLPFVNI